MNQHLKLAYSIGANTAREHFEKTARGEVITPALGAVSPLGAGIAGGVTAPEGKGWSTGASAGLGSLLGTVGGGAAGGVAGHLGGAGVHRLAKALGYDIDEEKAKDLGRLLGTMGGAMGGGAYGAHLGRRSALGEDAKEGAFKTARAPSDVADVAAAGLGGIPLVGPAAAGLASGMSGPTGLRQTTGMATTGGSAVGQALGGLGGAAIGGGLGAGGAALYNALKRDPTLWERITGGGPQDIDPRRAAGIGALIGGGLGTVGGGIYGAHKGRGYGEERGEQRDAIKRQIIEAINARRAAMQRYY
jgi:hypothetical protein